MVMPAPPSGDEAQRVARVRELALPEGGSEPLFDTLVRLAADVADAPCALISLIDDRRQRILAQCGLPGLGELPRSTSICAHTLAATQTLEIADTRDDPRSEGSPLVTGGAAVRFYAGVPIHLPDGVCVGSLCVMDRRPRTLDAAQGERLVRLASAVAEAIALRERVHHAARAAHALQTISVSGPAPASASVLDVLPVAVAVWGRDKRNVYANPAMKELLGEMTDLRPGVHLRDAIGPRAFDEGLPYREAALAGRPQEHVTRVERSDGTRDHRLKYLPWRDDRDEVVGYVAIAEDITAQRKAREALQALEASERLYRVLSDASPLGVYHTDAAGQCTYTNRRWHEIYGMPLAESLGDGWVRTLHPSDREAVFERWQHAAAAGGQFTMEYRVLRPDGSVRSVRSYACALTDAHGAIEGFVGTVEDVTELREADARRRESEAHVTELDALLAEREEMLQVLAHEVRQPLNNASAALQSAVALLAERGEKEATQRLARAQMVMGMVLSGIDNTLAASALLASKAGPTLADVDIDTLVAVTVRDLPTADRARVRVERATPTRTATLDMGLMRLALRNVLANAAEHSPPWSVVTLRIADSDEPLAILFDVIDEGSGIDPTVLPRLFDRGSRGRKASGRNGHGLGMYIVRRALELHGGRAEVLNTGPTGTTIRLTVNQGEPE